MRDFLLKLRVHGWLLFVGCIALLLVVGIAVDQMLLPVGIAITLITGLYYGLMCRRWQMPDKILIPLQPIVLSLTGSILLLFLEETYFKIILFFGLIILHLFFLFHLRYSRKMLEQDFQKGMLDSIRLIVFVNVFLASAAFYAPLFYFDIRYAYLYVVPYFAIVSCLFWSSAWIEGHGYPQRLLASIVFLLVISEVTVAQIWLPSSYIVQALITTTIFFLYYDWTIHKESEHVGREHDRFVALILALFVLSFLLILSQWR